MQRVYQLGVMHHPRTVKQNLVPTSQDTLYRKNRIKLCPVSPQYHVHAGQHLRTLRVPGSSINALAWEKGGLRIALAVESFLYFASVQPSYHWGYFAGTVVYAFSKADRPEACVVFWDLQTKETHAKYVKRLVTIRVGSPHHLRFCLMLGLGCSCWSSLGLHASPHRHRLGNVCIHVCLHPLVAPYSASAIWS